MGLPKDLEVCGTHSSRGQSMRKSRLTREQKKKPGSPCLCSLLGSGVRGSQRPDSTSPSGCGRKQRLPLQLSNSLLLLPGVVARAQSGPIDFRRDVSPKRLRGQGQEAEPSSLTRKASRGCGAHSLYFKQLVSGRELNPIAEYGDFTLIVFSVVNNWQGINRFFSSG